MGFRHALILAAGRGTRMLPLTDAIPKPMAPFRGSTLIADGISKISRHIPNVHVTIGYKKAMLGSHVIEHGAMSVLNTEGHSNSWWIYHSLLRFLNEPIVVLTCDNVTELDFEELYAEYEALERPYCMLVPVNPVAGLDGDFIHLRDQFVLEVNRNKPAATYCSGIQVLNPRLVAEAVPEGTDFYDVWRGLARCSELKASRKFPRRWFAVDTIEQLVAANAMDEGFYAP